MRISTFLKAGVVAVSTLVAGSAASAAVVFQDDFDGYGAAGTSTLNWGGAGGWSVSNGTVDIVAMPNQWGINCLGGAGKCIDLDGSSSNAGIFGHDFNLSAGSYSLSFYLSGNQRGAAADTAEITLGGLVNDTVVMNSGDDWTQFSYNFVVGTDGVYTLNFANYGGDNQGLMLDNVLISAIPEPATWLMMIMGFGLVGMASRRRTGIVAA